ncbi:MAG TPA: DUF1553 domain-containing protein, partial [Pirellulales bacterium]
YHVRTDFVPGEANATRDGLPRPFDAVLDAKTYRLIRGNEASPDESLAMEPGVPEVIGLALSKIQAIELPLEAAQPERRTWVVEAHRQAAGEKIAAAEAKLAPAREKLAHAEKAFAEHQANAPTPNAPKSETDTAEPPATQKDAAAVGSLAITEKFDALDPERWKLFGGDWVHEKGRLQQKQDGAQEAVLRWTGSPPRDFDATLKLTILGGSRWRSAGIAFDCSEEDPTKPTRPNDTTQFVYLSAFEGGPKVQAAWRRGGQANYPQDAMQARSVPINEPQTLRVQVRGDLINVSLNGEPALAWRTPLERRDGSLQFFTFDALVVVHEVSIAALAPDVPLRESNSPGPTPASPPGPGRAVEEARLEWELAEQSFAAAQAEQLSLERRTVATLQSRDDADKTLARSAALAQAEAQVAAARVALTQANLKLLRAASDKREGTENDVAKASESLDKAIKKREAPGDQFTRLVGAEWSATRFKNSGADDPPMAFPSQSTGRRTALAEWITDRRNPLTARVAVNHIWMRHFGEPLVATVFDFGRKGQAPSHPELLDWLACELIESGWSMKHVHRLIVESSTYRMSSSTSGAEANRKKDPDNLSLWRRTPMRLESQAVRDALLALAGTLDETRGGPSVPSDQQAESKRRSLYFFHSNNDRNQFLTTFDEALVTECYRREQSIVPQQALALTNSRLVLDAARPIAERLTKHLR